MIQKYCKNIGYKGCVWTLVLNGHSQRPKLSEYRALKASKILLTLRALELRIKERFGAVSLCKVCNELIDFTQEKSEQLERIAQPNHFLRACIFLVVVAGASLLLWLGTLVTTHRAWSGTPVTTQFTGPGLFSFLQGIDSSINLLLVMGAAVFFLLRLEGLWKRRHALKDLDELRSLIHVIDLHQLSKDPSVQFSYLSITPTQSSPDRPMSLPQLVRYLNYCSEMLSLAAKVAALYHQRGDDQVIKDTASELELLTLNLSSKIWQKITLVQGAFTNGQLTPSRSFSGGDSASLKPQPSSSLPGVTPLELGSSY
eukprot:g69150.t1